MANPNTTQSKDKQWKSIDVLEIEIKPYSPIDIVFVSNPYAKNNEEMNKNPKNYSLVVQLDDCRKVISGISQNEGYDGYIYQRKLGQQ